MMFVEDVEERDIGKIVAHKGDLEEEDLILVLEVLQIQEEGMSLIK